MNDGRRLKISERTGALREVAEVAQRRVTEHRLASAFNELI